MSWNQTLRSLGNVHFWAAAMLLYSVSCFAHGSQQPDQTPIHQREASMDLEKKYREAYQAWKSYISTPQIQESSRTSDYTNNPAFERLVALGNDALPFMMTDLEKGEFFLNEAVSRITGINVRSFYPEEKVVGAQDVSRLWLRWWREHGKAEYSSQQ